MDFLCAKFIKNKKYYKNITRTLHLYYKLIKTIDFLGKNDKIKEKWLSYFVENMIVEINYNTV